ncbi:MAG: membrane protein of unknown function [Parcubacteria group bacterium Gr01-1014_31]|nr:MAG: membrane protein of unknown function [Parcubacteria group bacterium Gr01-1014_31]
MVANGLTLAAVMMGLPYWLDEVATMVFIGRPFPEMLRYVATDIHPPLYFVLLQGWVTLFGWQPWVTAIPSLLFQVLSGLMLYRLADALFGRRAARLAALFFSSSFFLIFYATESRMYTLLLAAGLGSTLATWRIVQRPEDRWPWWWLFAWSVVGVYTQYLYWLLVVAQTLTVFALRRMGRTTVPAREWIVAHLGVLVAFLPWLPVMVGRLAGKTGQLTWMHTLPLGQKLLTIALDIFVPMNAIANIIGIGSWRAWAILALLASLFFFVDTRLTRAELGVRLRRDWPTPVLFCAGIVAVPPLIGSVVGAWFARYFMVTIALLGAAYAKWLSGARLKKTRTAAAVLLLIAAAAANWRFFFTVFRYEIAFRWSDVATTIRTGSRGTDAVFFATAEERLQFLYSYSGPLPVLSFLPRAYRHGDREVDLLRVAGLPIATVYNVGDALDDLRPYSSLWFIHGPSVVLVDPERLIERLIVRHCRPQQAYVFTGIPGVGVWQEIVATRYSACTWETPLRRQPTISGLPHPAVP